MEQFRGLRKAKSRKKMRTPQEAPGEEAALKG